MTYDVAFLPLRISAERTFCLSLLRLHRLNSRPVWICWHALMPTYEYQCSKCGRNFEKVQSIKENALTTCPRDVCGRKPWGKGKVLRRIGLGGGLIFKGSGFYSTDYRSENYKAGAKKENASQISSDSKTSTSTDSKAAKPKESTPAAAPAKPKNTPKSSG